MASNPMTMRRIRALLILLPLAACGGSDCVQPPCVLPLAISLTISSASVGGSAPMATVTLTGPEASSFQCNGTCQIAGPAGSYHLAVAAPGFAPAERTVQVQGTNPACGCGTTSTETVAIALTPQ